MRLILLFTWFLGLSLASLGQITDFPKVTKSTSRETRIERIELTAEATILTMVFRTDERGSNLPDMPPMFQDPRLRPGVTSSISIQPTSYLQTSSGKKLGFKKAVGIPKAPDRRSVKPGETVKFTLYFERIPPGFERIDFVESAADPKDGFSYWNFYGIQILNPADANRPVYFSFRGKVINQNTDEPIRASVWCLDSEGRVLDSLLTSRSGTFEFEAPAGPILLRAQAPDFESTELRYTLRDQTGDRPITLWLSPNTPETIKSIANESKRFTLDQVYFPTGRADLLSSSYPQLDSLARYLTDNPSLKIRIEGHTDRVGDKTLNQKLSLDRAFRVREYLIKKGVPGERLSFVGYGDTRPKVSGDSEEERQQNRRVEFVILDEEGKKTQEKD